ncbi:P-loop containing nucleoside triphosphate hydrolase protein [Kalaharituber pfeilii]|nr:P-loop containing nucleoside triphosphate hydrolase protein [Kalaharituber pfeilii]
MEAVGLAVGIVGLAEQLAKVSQEWSNIFSEMKEIGYAHDAVLHDLRTEGLRLKQWEQAWGLDNTSVQLQRLQGLDPKDERYRYAVACLARIVSVFAKVAELQSRYQIESEDNRQGKRNSLGVRYLFSKFRSKSPRPGSSTNASRSTSPSPQPSISSLTPGDLSLLENPRILANKQLLPGIDEEIACLSRVAQNLQQSVPTYRKLHWANTDKAKCNELVGQLTKYIDGLFNILPPNATIPSMPRSGLLHLSFNIPFSLPDIRRNSDFVGREALLEQIKREIEIEKGVAIKNITQVVLYGMGGIGKTQLALEYVYRHSEDYSAVFWINAASEQTTKMSFTHIMQRLIKYYAELSDLEPDYTRIGRLLGMAGKLDQVGMFTVQQPSEEQHIVNAVKEWLTAKDNTKWLLVFDNLDDLESFDINDYIPSTPHGTVIITSRRRESIQGRRGLEVMQMDHSEAEELLFKCAKLDLEKLPSDKCEHEKEAAVAIVQKLGYLPLAIEHAGAYIHVRDYLFSRYLEEYETNCTHLLSKKWKFGKRDRSVFAAWDLSFNAIQSQNSKTAELLLLCGFLDNNDICEELLQRGMKLSKNDTSLGDSIEILLSYSMAKRKNRGDSFNIHPVVHMWAQWKLEMEPERHRNKVSEAFLMVTSAITRNRRRKVEEWVFERRILPHILAVERHMKSMEIGNEQILTAVYNLCFLYEQHGYFRKAQEMYEVVLAGNEKLLGTGHPHTLGVVHNLALVFGQQGQYNKALELFDRALAGNERTLGVDHPNTLAVVHDMALVFQRQGQYNKALKFCARALAGEEKAQGADHPHTLLTVHGMAIIFKVQGCYDKALEWYERALAGQEKVLGTDHPNTLDTIHGMGVVFHQQGQHNKALEFYERALAGKEKAFGAEHPSTLTTIRNMAASFDAIGQSGKAQELRERASRGSSANTRT